MGIRLKRDHSAEGQGEKLAQGGFLVAGGIHHRLAGHIRLHQQVGDVLAVEDGLELDQVAVEVGRSHQRRVPAVLESVREVLHVPVHQDGSEEPLVEVIVRPELGLLRLLSRGHQAVRNPVQLKGHAKHEQAQLPLQTQGLLPGEEAPGHQEVFQGKGFGRAFFEKALELLTVQPTFAQKKSGER